MMKRACVRAHAYAREEFAQLIETSRASESIEIDRTQPIACAAQRPGQT